jgi:glucose-1-phosphate thymidylyltransferase
MCYYPIQTLVKAGIRDILIVTGGNHAGEFLRLLRNGEDFGLRSLQFRFQEGSGGIAQALSLAEGFVDGDDVAVMLGDNILQDDISDAVQHFSSTTAEACIFLKEVPDPQRFGTVVFDPQDKDKILEIEEKPHVPKSRAAVVGVYLYNGESLFDIIRSLKPSGRGELEITDVNNEYIRRGKLTYSKVQGEWTDAGTFDSLLRASNAVSKWHKFSV